jgi:hypothetical protein
VTRAGQRDRLERLWCYDERHAQSDLTAFRRVASILDEEPGRVAAPDPNVEHGRGQPALCIGLACHVVWAGELVVGG